jgi:hypothetical protein
MQMKVNAGDRVTIEGEEGIWDVQSAGNGSPIVAVTLNGNGATLKGIHRDKLTVLPKPADEGPFQLIPERQIMD